MKNPVVRFLSIVVSTAGFLALAVVGWGGVAAFFSNPARIALVVVLAGLTVMSFFAGGSLSPGVREDRGNRWVLPVFGVIGLLGGWLPAYAERLGFWTFDGNTVRWVGVLLFAAGGVLRLAPVRVLGHRFSGLVAIQPGHKLVTDGMYGVIRHPSYLGMIVNSLGWGLAFRSGVGVILTGLTLLPLIARIRAEEKLLLSEFGEEYEAYRARTSRLIPGVF